MVDKRSMASTTKLPVFDEKKPCEKCGLINEMNFPIVQWCDGKECSHPNPPSGDHLHQICEFCGYEGLKAPKDSK